MAARAPLESTSKKLAKAEKNVRISNANLHYIFGNNQETHFAYKTEFEKYVQHIYN